MKPTETSSQNLKKCGTVSIPFDQEWQETYDTITDFVAVLDVNFCFVKINKAMARLLGKTAEELIGTPCYEAMHGRTSHWPNCPHAKMLKTGQATTE